MIPISGNPPPGFDPAQMQQRFADADTDQNSSISKAEAQEAVGGSGLSEAMFDKMFTKMDSNGDGELSSDEQAEMLAQMEKRMEKFAGGGGGEFSMFGNNDSDSTLESLLESLSSDSEDDEEPSEFDKALEKLREDPNSAENRRYASELINDKLPVINTTA